MAIIKKNTSPENKIDNVEFVVHKFTNRTNPEDPKRTLIISCFSEFGCEVLGVMYCVPRLIEENPGMYYIVMGWYGRDYLYRHLVDEFWELKEEYQWLRDKSLAFHHNSKNLTKIEKEVNKFGKVLAADALGKIAVGNTCKQCGYFWGQVSNVERCNQCGSLNLTKSLFADVNYWKQRMRPIPRPSLDKVEEASKYLNDNPVGIIARNRKTYKRNLQPEFYVKLIKLLQRLGYSPIWLGEKQTTLECPVDGIIDMTRKPEARDLELTLALISKLEFTVQFWTASTRLSGMMGTPFLLFESPDQMFGQGQEAYRLGLCTLGKSKIVISHYLKTYEDNDAAINLISEAIAEMRRGDWSNVIGMVDRPEVVKRMREQNLHRLVGL